MPQLGLGGKPLLPSHLHFPLLMVSSGRPLSSVITGAISFSAVWLRRGFSAHALLVGLVMSLVAMFGFVLNDIVDYRKDASAGVQRPIAAGALSRTAASFFSVFLLLAAVLLSAFVGRGGVMIAFTVLALILYSPFARSLPLLKGLYVAGLCLLPLLYAAAASNVHVSWRAYAILFSFVAGREMLMDANEIEGDRQAGMATIAVALGSEPASRIGKTLMIAAGVCLAFATQGPFTRTLAILAGLMLLIVLVWPHLKEGKRIELSRLPMLLAALVVAAA